MEEKLSDLLQKIELFTQNNNKVLKRMAMLGGALLILGLLGTYLSFSAIKKLDQAEQSLEEARREIQAAQSQMGEVIKDIQKEKERLLYFKNQFDHIRTELKVFEAKNKVEKDSAIHKLDVLKTTGDSLAKLLGI